MKITGMIVGMLVVVGFVCVPAFAAEASKAANNKDAVIAKLDEAAKAETPEKAAAAVAEAADLLKADGSTGGAYAKAMAGSLRAMLSDLGSLYKSGAKMVSIMAPPVTRGVKDFYGAQLPVSQGDYDKAAAYMKSIAEGAPDSVKEMMTAAAAALSGADKEAALPKMKAGLAAGLLGEAIKLAAKEEYRQAGRWLEEAVRYLRAESNYEEDQGKAQAMMDAAATLTPFAQELNSNEPLEIKYLEGCLESISKAFGIPVAE